VRAIVEAASRTDIVEQWKRQSLRGIRREPGHDDAHVKRLGLRLHQLSNWFRRVWRAHDAALGIEKLIARAEALLAADDAAGAAQIARRALEHALLDDYRVRLWLITAWAGVGQRDPFLTHAAMLHLPTAACTIDIVSAYLSTCNRTDEALALLMEARRLGHRSRATSKQLLDLLVMRGAAREASRVANEDRHLLASDELAALADAGLFRLPEPGPA
jgi:hypothetical protein